MVKSFVTDSAQGYPVFRVIGDVDFSNQAEFETALRGVDAGSASALIVSFEECTFFDSSIVGALMQYWRAPERSWDVVLVTKPENPANRVFEIVGIDRVYPTAHSLDEAVARAQSLASAREATPPNPA
jgi:anti-anti-sigma factor